MTLKRIIEIANAAYPDDFIAQYHENPDMENGDTLAKFIECELRETYDADATDKEQLAEALRVIDRAADEVRAVADAFDRAIPA